MILQIDGNLIQNLAVKNKQVNKAKTKEEGTFFAKCLR
jgi:hypothetical protein